MKYKNLWAIVATYVTKNSAVIQFPYFFLCGDICGFNDRDGAETFAKKMLSEHVPCLEVHACAMKING